MREDRFFRTVYFKNVNKTDNVTLITNVKVVSKREPVLLEILREHTHLRKRHDLGGLLQTLFPDAQRSMTFGGK